MRLHLPRKFDWLISIAGAARRPINCSGSGWSNELKFDPLLPLLPLLPERWAARAAARAAQARWASVALPMVMFLCGPSITWVRNDPKAGLANPNHSIITLQQTCRARSRLYPRRCFH